MHVVPHHPGRDGAVLWIQAEQRESGWSLAVLGPDGPVGTWNPADHVPALLPNTAAAARDTRMWRWELTGLAPGTEYTVRYVERGTDAAVFRTLPDDLSRPFTILLGSCYAEDSDLPDPLVSKVVRASGERRLLGPLVAFVQEARHLVGGAVTFLRNGPVTDRPRGHVSRRYQRLWETPDRPDVKILVGDQVYLDAPWYWFLGVPLPGSPVARHISATYSRTWEKLAWMLSHGGTVCVSDDHEFWNDFPYRPPLVTVFTKFWLRRFRGRWEEHARRFLEAVQLPRPLSRLAVGAELDVLVADTRINRSADGFMAEADFTALLGWIGGLRGPGVLAIGQPLLGPARSVKKRLIVTDHNLPAFRDQYVRLCDALAAAPHDVLVLAGDVHYGRVTELAVPRADRARPGRIVEVISSPMALVKLAGSRFAPDDPADTAPGAELPIPSWAPRFAPHVPGAVERRVRLVSVATPPGEPHCPDHYATLRFSRGASPGEVAVEVTLRSLAPGTDGGPGEILLRSSHTLA